MDNMENLINSPAIFRAKAAHGNRNVSKEERRQILKDLQFEQLAFRNHWTKEEMEANRPEFDKKYDEDERQRKEEARLIMDKVITGGENLSEFENKKAEKLLEDPETSAIANGFVNMLAAGVNDPENVEKYTK